jgi:hypothetical protein
MGRDEGGSGDEKGEDNGEEDRRVAAAGFGTSYMMDEFGLSNSTYGEGQGEKRKTRREA